MVLIEKKLAVVSVDMHRGHLDPEVATLPLEPEKSEILIRNTKRLFDGLRVKKVPIIHVVQTIRGQWEVLNNPYFREKLADNSATRKNVARHNIEDSPGTEVILELYDSRDYMVKTKKRFSSFYATDLEFLLHALNIKTVALTGVNTNSCVLCTAFEAHKLDFKVLLIRDCVNSMDGEELHKCALKVFETAIGTIVSVNELLKELKISS